jgi:hypothetical protein
MLPAHEEILSIQLVTNNKYARQVRSCAAGCSENTCRLCLKEEIRGTFNDISGKTAPKKNNLVEK